MSRIFNKSKFGPEGEAVKDIYLNDIRGSILRYYLKDGVTILP